MDSHLNTISGVRISSIAAALPFGIEQNSAIEQDENQYNRMVASIGIKRRHIADNATCASDLSAMAADTLLKKHPHYREKIDTIINVTQTPDYMLPSTACILQHRLGLGHHCRAFDINMGCSGYVYGLWMAYSLIACQSANTVLLLTGDTISKTIDKKQKSSRLLFGDAGSATLIEKSQYPTTGHFVLGTDGSKFDSLMLPNSAYRKDRNLESYLVMKGGDITAFVLKTVPKMVKELAGASNTSLDSVDYWVFHQANQHLLNHIKRVLQIQERKFVNTLNHLGNTSGTSIPLALCKQFGNQILTDRKLGLFGFGVGLSWGGVFCDTENIDVLPITYQEREHVYECAN